MTSRNSDPSTSTSAAVVDTATVARTRDLLASILGPTHPLLSCSSDPEGAGHGRQPWAGLGRLLERPPFGYMRALVMEVVRVTGFAQTLLVDAALACTSTDNDSRAGRVRFLVRLIACVAFVDPRAHGYLLVTAVPSRLLVGADPLAAHHLLQYLVQASCCSNAVRRTAEARVARVGDVALYERSVRLRAAITHLQQRVRAHLRRRQQRQNSTSVDQPAVADATTPNDKAIPSTEAPAQRFDLKSLPMRVSTRRHRQRCSDGQPLILCLSTAINSLPPPSTRLADKSSPSCTSGVASISDDGAGTQQLSSGTAGAERKHEEGSNFKQLIRRSWR